MRQSSAHLSVALATCFLASSGCSQSSNPTQPSASTVPLDGNDLTASVTVPRALSPAVAAQIRNLDQPVTLVVANAVITQATAVTYTFEVAPDATFGNKVYSKSGGRRGGQRSDERDDRQARRRRRLLLAGPRGGRRDGRTLQFDEVVHDRASDRHQRPDTGHADRRRGHR